MSRYRIMIVDDEEDLRHVLRLTLESRFEVVEACDGLDALSKLETHEPDFAIIDVMMPLMDGFQLCEAIRRHKSFKNMQVMFLSGHGSRENIKRGYAVGANLFMPKPIDPERLVRNVEFTIRHEMPPLRNKRYSIEQLRQMEAPSGGGEPAPAPKNQPQAQAAPTPASGIPRPRLLLIDDDEELVRMMTLALRERFEVFSAADGMDAVQRLVDYEPDLLLLDIMMPRMNGYQFLQSLRGNSAFERLPVVVISAKASQRERDYAARLGANAFLAKPYRLNQLLQAIEGIIDTPGFRVQPKRRTPEQIEEGLEAEVKARTARDEELNRRSRFAPASDAGLDRDRDR